MNINFFAVTHSVKLFESGKLVVKIVKKFVNFVCVTISVWVNLKT